MYINHNHHRMCLRFNIRPLSYKRGATNPAGLDFYKPTEDISIYIDNDNQQCNKKCFEVSFNYSLTEQPLPWKEMQSFEVLNQVKTSAA